MELYISPHIHQIPPSPPSTTTKFVPAATGTNPPNSFNMYLNIRTVSFLLTATFAVTSCAGSTDTDKATGPLVHLPPPTGPKGVGVVRLELTDDHRDDYFAPGTRRRIPVSVHYPAHIPSGAKPATYLPPAVAAVLTEAYSFPNGTFAPLSSDAVEKAPPAVGSFTKVILFSPGYESTRLVYATLVEDLASHGYIVISMDHAYDALAVEWADGTMTLKSDQAVVDDLDVAHAMYEQRVKDALYVAKRAGAITKKAGIRTTVEQGRLGMFGHSFGGSTTHGAMIRDRNIAAGINMDGSFFDTATKLDSLTDNPGQILLMTSEAHTSMLDENLGEWKKHQRGGYAREIVMKTGGHLSYGDAGAIIDMLGGRDLVDNVEGLIGTIWGPRSVELTRAYVRDFFDWQLKGGNGALSKSKGPKKYPEMVWVEERKKTNALE